MKKVIIVVVLLLVIASIGGYFYYNYNENNKKLEKELKKQAVEYFDTNVNTNTSISAYTVTLKDLEQAGYDVSNFKNCKDDTKAILTLDYTSGNVKSVEIKLNCNFSLK